ncbi:hypothetical protein TIFTF001_045148 [Ficus carica]|uniref:Uncharacterized protein n=1 Tax=Ficus carica TaxID=3494 RepID=A0AA88CJV9_FICCA|nr:hypothetical protein TIFTF001_045148 [Ficus carica]
MMAIGGGKFLSKQGAFCDFNQFSLAEIDMVKGKGLMMPCASSLIHSESILDISVVVIQLKQFQGGQRDGRNAISVGLHAQFRSNSFTVSSFFKLLTRKEERNDTSFSRAVVLSSVDLEVCHSDSMCILGADVATGKTFRTMEMHVTWFMVGLEDDPRRSDRNAELCSQMLSLCGFDSSVTQYHSKSVLIYHFQDREFTYLIGAIDY